MKKVLLIEDEKEVLENVSQILELEGYSVLMAENGITGVQMARKFVPDVIVCDIMMPELDGYDVARTLRNDPITSSIPFVFLTARTDRNDMRAGMNLGADDYLTKPFKRDELIRSISTRITKAERTLSKYETRLKELRDSISLSVPHEMLTPLNIIIGYASIIDDPDSGLTKDEEKEMIGGILKAGERLGRIIKNFLLYVELEVLAGDRDKREQVLAIRTNFSKADMTAAAFECAARHGRESDLDVSIFDARLKVGPEHLRKLFVELLDNAFRYSKSGTAVSVSAAIAGPELAVTIADSGRGMSREQIDNIGACLQFERKIYEQQGTGLGLFLARRLVELYGGSFHIESEPDGGTRVTFGIKFSN